MAVWFQFRVRVGPKFSSERERLYNNAMRKRKSFLCYAILRKAQQKRRLFQVNSLCERNSHAILNTLPTAIPMLITQKPVRKRLTDTKMRFFFSCSHNLQNDQQGSCQQICVLIMRIAWKTTDQRSWEEAKTWRSKAGLFLTIIFCNSQIYWFYVAFQT